MSPLDERPSLRRYYYRRVRNAFIAAGAIHLLAFLFAPPYTPNPPVMRADPIRLLPSGSAGLGTTLSPVASGVAAPTTPTATTAPRASVLAGVYQTAGGEESQVRTEQWAPAAGEGTGGTAGGGSGDAKGGLGGAGADEAPPTYYGYDTPPRALRTYEPAYPPEAKNSGFEGTVVVNVNLDERGRILRAWVAAANAPEILIATALDAVYQFDFAPGRYRGAAVRSTVAIPFWFHLNKTS